METKYIETDLLIIGAGSAGCMAAIRAKELQPDLKVTFFEKGDIKYSGSIARGMDALNIVAIPNYTSPELYVESASLGCDGVLDQESSYVMADRSYELLKKIEKWGVYFPVDKNGKYRVLQYHVKGNFQVAMEEPNLKTMIAARALENGTQVVNRIMGLELLMDDERVAGAIGMNVRTGELIACKAKAVIITAGGQARFSLPNSGYLYGTFDYPGNSGDGYVMAHNAGAELTGMEDTCRSIIIKDANMPLLAVTITRGARLLDIADNILMEGYCHSYGVMDNAERSGQGPLRIRLSHLPLETIQEIEHTLFTTERPAQERFFKGRNVNIRKDDIELWPTEFSLCGGHGSAGIYVDKKTATSVPGLYAAGDVASVPGQHLSGALVFGEVAAEQAVQFIQNNSGVSLDKQQVKKSEEKRKLRSNSTKGEIGVKELEYKVRRFIGDYVVSPKNEYKLNRWLECSKGFKEEIETQVRIKNGHDLSKLYEVEHIVQCADYSATASLLRKESRWGFNHYRSDFPETDHDHWTKHILVKKNGTTNELFAETKAVQDLNGKEVL